LLIAMDTARLKKHIKRLLPQKSTLIDQRTTFSLVTAL
jgi:hypothetical protein